MFIPQPYECFQTMWSFHLTYVIHELLNLAQTVSLYLGDPTDWRIPALHHDLCHILHHRHSLRHKRPPPFLCYLPPHGSMGEEPLPAETTQTAVYAGTH